MSLKEREVEALETTYAPAGVLLGTVWHNVAQYRGVRYARASRFAMPQLLSDSSTPNGGECLGDGPVAWQNPHLYDPTVGPRPDVPAMSEDCLNLKITCPAAEGGERGEGAYPVIVFIHGGGYIFGSGSDSHLDPSDLVAQENVVVVNLNYRLGAFGFLPLPGIAPANLGLWDVATGLRWVRENIAAFGGDPNNVTLAGHSAGADLVVHLLRMPAARGLFSRAIVQSAPLGLAEHRAEIARAVGKSFLNRLTRGPFQASAAEIVVAAQAAAAAAPQLLLSSALPFAPVPGCNGLPALPDALNDRPHADAQDYAPVDLLVGYTRHDAAPFILEFEPLRPLRRRFFGDFSVRMGARFLSPALTHHIFARPAHDLARAMRRAEPTRTTAPPGSPGASAGRPRPDQQIARRRVQGYRFMWRSASSEYRACHGVELPFLFGSRAAWGKAPMLQGAAWGEVARGSRALRAAWASFARMGDARFAEQFERFDVPPLLRVW